MSHPFPIPQVQRQVQDRHSSPQWWPGIDTNAMFFPRTSSVSCICFSVKETVFNSCFCNKVDRLNFKLFMDVNFAWSVPFHTVWCEKSQENKIALVIIPCAMTRAVGWRKVRSMSTTCSRKRRQTERNSGLPSGKKKINIGLGQHSYLGPRFL